MFVIFWGTLLLLCLFGLGVSILIKFLKQKDNIPVVNEQWHMIVQKKKYFFLWEDYPGWSLFPFCIGMLFFLFYVVVFNDIHKILIVSIRYILIFLVNINLLSNSLIYKLMMFWITLIPILFMILSRIWYLEITYLNTYWLWFVIYLLSSLLLLVITCVRSNMFYKRKFIQTPQDFINNEWDQISSNNANILYWVFSPLLIIG